MLPACLRPHLQILKKSRCIVAAPKDDIFRPYPTLHTFSVIIKSCWPITTLIYIYRFYILLNLFLSSIYKKYSVTNFLLYISYKTTIFQNIIPKSILVRFWWYFTNRSENVCSFLWLFKIFFGSTDFKYSWFKHKLKLFVFKCTIIVLRFLTFKI